MTIADLTLEKYSTRNQLNDEGKRERVKVKVKAKRKVKLASAGTRFGHFMIDYIATYIVALPFTYVLPATYTYSLSLNSITIGMTSHQILIWFTTL